MTIEPNCFERQIMEKFLAGDDPVLESLREQFRVCRATRREMTGVGFFLDFSVPENAPRAGDNACFVLGDVFGEIEGLEHGAGFLLFVEKGSISVLEGYCYDESWPDVIRSYKLIYTASHLVGTKFWMITHDTDERDMEALRSEWSQ